MNYNWIAQDEVAKVMNIFLTLFNVGILMYSRRGVARGFSINTIVIN